MAEAKNLPLNEIEGQAERLRDQLYEFKDRAGKSYARKGIFTVPFGMAGGVNYAAIIRHAVDGYQQCRDSLPFEPPASAAKKESYDRAKKSVGELRMILGLSIGETSDKLVYESKRTAIDAIKLTRAIKTPNAEVLKEIRRKRSYVNGLMGALKALEETGEGANVLEDYDVRRFGFRSASMQNSLNTINKIEARYESAKPLAPIPAVPNEQPAGKGGIKTQGDIKPQKAPAPKTTVKAVKKPGKAKTGTKGTNISLGI